MPSFASCFPSTSTSDAVISDEVDHNPLLSQKTKKGCVFCDVSKERGFNIVHEDDQLIAFHDRKPRAKIHLLIIPKYHLVSSVRELTRDHIPLLNSMISLATTLIPPSTSTSTIPKMGFHIPPFSSVPHLHLHVFSGEHTFLGKFKYPISNSDKLGGKGIGWFVTANQVEKILQNGERVGLGRA